MNAYLEYTKHSEAPETFHFWTGVSVIAGALRRRVWIEQRYFQWTPNFYIVFVAPPGVATKTTTVGVGMRLLREVPKVHFGPQSITWQALTQDLAAHLEMVDTGEVDSLGSPIQQPMSCVTCAIDELGTFLKPQDVEMIDALTSLWDARMDKWEKKTKTQSNDVIENPWINIIGCTTPSWIGKNFTEEMIGGGLASRTIFIFEQEKRQLVAYPSDVIGVADFEAQAEDLVHDLCEIGSMFGEYHLSAEAKAWGVDWYEKHWTEIPQHLADERYGGYRARKQTHIHKLAMIFAAAESNNLVIEKRHLVAADKLITRSERSMNRVFSTIGQSDISRHIATIQNYLSIYGDIEVDRLWRNCISTMARSDFKTALKGGIEAKVIRSYVSNNPPGTFVGLPTKKGP